MADVTTDPGDDLVHTETARSFVAALRAVEDDGDTTAMAALFGEGAELHRLDGRDPLTGPSGAHRFWSEYRGAFGGIRSVFSRVTETSDRAVLEWTGHGTLTDGRPLSYDGISVLDLDGDHLAGFRTYYDTAALLSPPRADTGTGTGTAPRSSTTAPAGQGDVGARTLDHTARDSGFVDDETLLAGRGTNG